MPLRARKSSTTLLSAILTHHGLVKEVDEGELPAIRTLRKGSTLDWLFHASNASFSSDKNLLWWERQMLSKAILAVNCFMSGGLWMKDAAFLLCSSSIQGSSLNFVSLRSFVQRMPHEGLYQPQQQAYRFVLIPEEVHINATSGSVSSNRASRHSVFCGI